MSVTATRADGLPPAGLGRRFLAVLLDAVLAGLLVAPAVLVAARLGRGDGGPWGALPAGVLLLVQLVQWQLHGQRGWTVGRLALRVRTVDEQNGRPLGLARVLVRGLVVAAGALAAGVGEVLVLVSPLFDARRRGWHDRAVSALVVRVPPGTPASWPREVRAGAPSGHRGPGPGRPAALAAPVPSPGSVGPAPGSSVPTMAPAAAARPPDTAAAAPDGYEPSAAHRFMPAPDALGGPGQADSAATRVIAAVPPPPWAVSGPVGRHGSEDSGGREQDIVAQRLDALLAPRRPRTEPGVPPLVPPEAVPPEAVPPEGSASVPEPDPVPPPARAWAPPPAADVLPPSSALDPQLEMTRRVAGHVAGPDGEPTAEVALSDGRVLTLRGTVLLGRNPAARPGVDVVRVVDPGRSVSKSHVLLQVDSTGLWVADAGSTNGTLITLADGQQIVCVPDHRVRVPAGSIVSFGEHGLRVLREPGTAPPTALAQP